MKIELDEKETEIIINYLASKPYGEVAHIITPLIVKMQKAKQQGAEKLTQEESE